MTYSCFYPRFCFTESESPRLCPLTGFTFCFVYFLSCSVCPHIPRTKKFIRNSPNSSTDWSSDQSSDQSPDCSFKVVVESVVRLVTSLSRHAHRLLARITVYSTKLRLLVRRAEHRACQTAPYQFHDRRTVANTDLWHEVPTSRAKCRHRNRSLDFDTNISYKMADARFSSAGRCGRTARGENLKFWIYGFFHVGIRFATREFLNFFTIAENP